MLASTMRASVSAPRLLKITSKLKLACAGSTKTRRFKRFSTPRFEAYSWVADATGLSPTALGRLFNRERKSISHGIAKFKRTL